MTKLEFTLSIVDIVVMICITVLYFVYNYNRNRLIKRQRRYIRKLEKLLMIRQSKKAVFTIKNLVTTILNCLGAKEIPDQESDPIGHLKAKLQIALESENYEQAAELREEITKLEQGGSHG